MAEGSHASHSLELHRAFDWVLLIELLVCGALTIFFLFYFNRLFAVLVSYGLRTYSWRKYRVYVDVQAIQVSLLAGRIFFKGFRYHGKNETILIQSGHVTWRYWYRNVKEVDCARSIDGKRSLGINGKEWPKHTGAHGEKGGIESSNRPLPCRLSISMQGLEWYLYNRSAAYDALVTSILSKDGSGPKSEEALEKGPSCMEAEPKSFSASQADRRSRHSSTSSPDKSSIPYGRKLSNLLNRIHNVASSEHKKEAQDSPVLSDMSVASDFPLLRILPIHIACNKGAVVMGNESARCVLIVKFDKASGEIDASYCPTPDPFRQLINFQFTHPVMQMKPNLAYKEPPSGMAAEERRSGAKQTSHRPASHPGKVQEKPWNFRRFGKGSILSYGDRLKYNAQHISDDVSHRGPKPGVRRRRWAGLSRYLDPVEIEGHEQWRSIEYAACSTIIDSPGLSISYYWDVAGVVTQADDSVRGPKPETANINRGLPPAWGLDLTFEGGTINYGPWTDRHRVELQSIFFPRLFKDAVPATVLNLGEKRASTVFKVFIELRKQMTLRIPTRESSKDYNWTIPSERYSTYTKRQRKNVDGKNGKRSSGDPIRPFGWLDIKIPSDSTISYVVDMAASTDGFHSTLDLDFHGAEVSTSVNHGILWRSDSLKTTCELPTPLQWNALHTWIFNISSDSPELFLLREHIILFSDLVTDWSTGPPPDIYTFTQFEYVINLTLRDFQLYLNVNDANVINNPCDLDDNTFTIIRGPSLESNIVLPLTKYRSDWNEIPFQVNIHKCRINTHTPPWKTQSAFLKSESVGTMKAVSLCGRYGYCTTEFPSCADTLILDIHGSGPSLHLFGFVIRYFMKIKDNYIGEDIHFKTLDEYQALQAKRDFDLEDTDDLRKPKDIKNGLDVIMNIEAVDVLINLPANLYAAGDGVQISLTCLNVDLRFTNYYMDLAVKFSPLSASLVTGNGALTESQEQTSETQLFVDGLDIHGHRLFGLPPTEPTYMCNWDFSIGKVTGECSPEFLRKLVSGIRSFSFSFDDDENSLPPIRPDTIPDVTFLRARLQSLHVCIHIDHAAFLLSTSAVKFSFNDWATTWFSKRVDLSLPDLRIDCLRSDSGSRRQKVDYRTNHTDGHLETAVTLSIFEKKIASTEFFRRQQQHIGLHDQWTSRSKFLQRLPKQNDFHPPVTEDGEPIPPTMPLPSMPPPNTDVHGCLPERTARSQVQKTSPTSSRRSSFLLHSIPRKTSTSMHHTSRSTSSNPKSDAVRTSSWVHSSGRLPQSPLNESISKNDAIPSQSHSSSSLSHPAFSSSFLSPYFPLRFAHPSTDDLPPLQYLPSHEAELDLEDTNLPSSMATSKSADEDRTHTTLIIKFGPGLVAFVTPEAVASTTQLLRQFQGTGPADILDTLQVDVISKVSESAKPSRSIRRVLDLNLKVPYVHLRFTDTRPEPLSVPNRHTDAVYNVQLRRFSTILRCISRPHQQHAIEDGIRIHTFHARLDHMGFSIGRSPTIASHVQAAIQGTIDDIVFQFYEDKFLSAILQFKGLELATQSSQMDHIACLIPRIRIYAQELSRDISQFTADKNARLKALVFFLISNGKNIPDPAFSTKPSHVLRTVPDHLRWNDSWKIISRLRQIYKNVSAGYSDGLSTALSRDCPVDAESQVIEILDEWKSWETGHVKQSYVMQNIYGPRNDPTSATGFRLPFKVSVKTKTIKIIVDPGPNQSEVGLDVLVVCANNNVPGVDTDGSLVPPPNRRRPTTIVEFHSEKTMIKLNWDLCEPAARILMTYRENPAISQSTTEQNRHSHTITDNQYQIVYVTYTTIISLDSPNIECIAVWKSLQGSIVTQADLVERSQLVNVALCATTATPEILSHGRLLATSKVVQPILYVSQLRRASDGKPAMTTQLVGSCKELSCNIEEEISGLMHTIDLIVVEEFTQLHDLLGRPPTHYQHHKTRKSMDRDTSNGQFSVALSVDTYRLSVVLIPSLSYVMSGHVARASVTPKSRSSYAFDFDLKEQEHRMLVQKGADKDSLSTLRIPPVNGCIDWKHSNSRNHCQALVSVDAVEIEAAAISNFLVTLSRLELTNFTKEIARDWKSVRAHIDGALESQAQGPLDTSVPVNPFSYDCRLAVVGIKVHATAPIHPTDSETGEIELNLGSVRIRASSKAKAQDMILNSPDIHLALPHISANLICCRGLLRQLCGTIAVGAYVECSSGPDQTGGLVASYRAEVNSLQIELFPETASIATYIVGHLQGMVKGVDLSREAHYLRKLRKLKIPPPAIAPSDEVESEHVETTLTAISAVYSLEMLRTQIQWIARTATFDSGSGQAQGLVLGSDRINLVTRKGRIARLKIDVLRLQMMPAEPNDGVLSPHSALLPEVVFNVACLSSPRDRKISLQATGKLLELRFTPQFILPATKLQRSMAAAGAKFKEALASWDRQSSESEGEEKSVQSYESLMSVLVNADFAGAVVYIQGTETLRPESAAYQASGSKMPHRGRHEQAPNSGSKSTTTLRAPGVAVKMEYKGDSQTSSSLSGEVKINSSTNILYPSFVPLVLEITSSIKDVISKLEEEEKTIQRNTQPDRDSEEDSILQPEGILGRCKLNVGLRICKQEFTLSCQPIAKVTASTEFEDVYITIGTVQSPDYGQFFTISAVFSRIQAAVQHVYSRESTGSIEIESIALSVMNSKHLSGTSGISAILRVGPTNSSINARQAQDFLLFRDLWIPTGVHANPGSAPLASAKEPQAYLVQRSHQVAAASAVPWDIAVVITELKLQMELGQALGRSCLTISDLWASSRKSSDWEQNLCLGFDKIAINGSGRLSESVELHSCKIRTSIQWPPREQALVERPLVQAAVRFDRLLVKVAFDHHIFLAAKVNSFTFFMYNVREQEKGKSDRLIATLEGDEVHVFSTATSAAQGAALYQAITRLVQEKQAALEASLHEVRRYIKGRSNVDRASRQPSSVTAAKDNTWPRAPSSLDTDVTVTIKSLSLGVFPNTLFDSQVFKVEIRNALAGFVVVMDQGRIHSKLDLTLGQLRIAVSVLRRMLRIPTNVEEVDIDDIVNRTTGSRDGTILKVPGVVATMQTWQDPDSNHIDYIFRSSFEGKVDVGWNYSRIGFIRDLWSSHSKALVQRLGKPLSPSKVKITAGPRPDRAGADADPSRAEGSPEKITAVVNVPQSRYEYRALEPPVIETPQLRDMGEATPPLEWIGFQRDRLPNLTHQIIIVGLLGVAREVEDAYSRILGSS